MSNSLFKKNLVGSHIHVNIHINILLLHTPKMFIPKQYDFSLLIL